MDTKISARFAGAPPFILEAGYMNTLTDNWKTTLAGLLALAASLAPVWAPANIATKIQTSAAVFAASGLIASKDHDK